MNVNPRIGFYKYHELLLNFDFVVTYPVERIKFDLFLYDKFIER